MNEASMELLTYRKKRNFGRTPEPKGTVREKPEKALVFVVQKHDATRLHYDFRIEMDGVLKSWAVPKGPSMNPSDKRLAVMVEDHPFEYRDFEGEIPEGNYGAGSVIVWDNGYYEPVNGTAGETREKNISRGLKKGHLSFILKGKKLKGAFSLVRINDNKGSNWLLIKKEDRYATTEDILKKERSVLSRKKLKRRKQNSNGVMKRTRKKAQRTSPMLATLKDKPFNDKNWIFEKKYDGYRIMALIDGKRSVELYSRNLLTYTQIYEVIAGQLKSIRHVCLLDGEVVVEDKKGISRFQLLQNYQRTGEGKLKYYVFDILNFNGIDLTGLPLLERKDLLEMLVKKYKRSMPDVIYSGHTEGKGIVFYRQAKRTGLEGIIAKDRRSPYRPGRRSGEWLKIKTRYQQEAAIIGITEPKGGRHYFGSLLLGVYHQGQLVYIGNCGAGFTESMLKELYEKLKPFFTGSSPLRKKIRAGGKIQWVEPRLVCEVKFSEWTHDGSMRHPVFLGLREDKSPEEVEREV